MKLVLFDCDGTIVDSQHMIVAAMDRAIAANGLPPVPRAAGLGVVGLSLAPAISRLLPDADARVIDAVAEAYKGSFSDLRGRPEHHEPLFPLARETILALAGEHDTVLGIATGKSRRGVDALIEREGFEGLFATIQTADDNPSKPDPGMVLRAMRETSRAPDRTVMVGDTTFDVEMARAAGVHAIGVSWGYHPVAMLQASGAHAMIESYADLPEVIARLVAVMDRAS